MKCRIQLKLYKTRTKNLAVDIDNDTFSNIFRILLKKTLQFNNKEILRTRHTQNMYKERKNILFSFFYFLYSEPTLLEALNMFTLNCGLDVL